jgi:hypothetical protein
MEGSIIGPLIFIPIRAIRVIRGRFSVGFCSFFPKLTICAARKETGG